MQLGIFDKTFVRDTLESTLDAVRESGFSCIQTHLDLIGSESMPEIIPESHCKRVREACLERAITVAAVSGTFNMIDPDKRRREEGLRRLEVLAQSCHALGTDIITLCSGTRNTESMWRPHPGNVTSEAWNDLLASMAEAASMGEAHEVTMAFEPEVANVVDSAKRARQLLNEIRSPRLKVVIDGANIYHAGELAKMQEILEEAFDLLGDAIVHAHAKDLDHDGQAGNLAAGTGLLDYDAYLGLLQKVGFDGPLVLHGLTEAEVPFSRDFLREKLGRLTDC